VTTKLWCVGNSGDTWLVIEEGGQRQSIPLSLDQAVALHADLDQKIRWRQREAS
jgi:hypothetical protein